MTRTAFVALMFVGVASPAAAQTSAAPQESAKPTPAAWTLVEGELKRGDESVTLPCIGTAFATAGDRAAVACDDGGLLVVDMSAARPRPVEVRRMMQAVPATSVESIDGELWVVTPNGSRPLEAFETAAPAPQPPPPAKPVVDEEQPEPAVTPPKPATPKPEPVSKVGQVVDLGTGWVVVDLGSDDGLVEKGWVEFFRLETVDLGAGQSVEQDRRLGLGQVDTVSKTRARIELGLNEGIPLGANVRRYDETVSTTGRRITPPRPAGLWEVTLNVRPFLALQTLGGGGILDGSIGRRFDIPLAVELYFHPFAFGVARDGDIFTFAGNAVVSYDTTAFQIGLGAGASRINTLRAGGGTDFLPEGTEEPSFRAGFSAAQFVRLGSLDGLHISVLNNFILFEDEFVFGGITLDGAIPITLFREPAWIRARGGGGVPGYVFAELGIRILARGNGGPGSIFLTPTVGGGLLTGERWTECEGYPYFEERPAEPGIPTEPQPGICRDSYSYGGPLVGFGVEWRF